MKDSLRTWLGIGGKSLRTQLDEKEEEIKELKKHLANARKDNSVLCVENRKLRIESAEMRAAYNSLKEILQKRAEAAEAAKASQTAAPVAEPDEAVKASTPTASQTTENLEAAQLAISEIVAAVEASISS